jgi:hypothetical protein
MHAHFGDHVSYDRTLTPIGMVPRRNDNGLSNDSKDRAQQLLKKLARAIENRSKELNSTHKYPHTS